MRGFPDPGQQLIFSCQYCRSDETFNRQFWSIVQIKIMKKHRCSFSKYSIRGKSSPVEYTTEVRKINFKNGEKGSVGNDPL